MASVRLGDVDRECYLVERHPSSDDVGYESTAPASAGGRLAVDCAVPGLEIHTGHHVGLDLRVEPDELRG